jgi:thiosulfate/3-mercaptopyruvate sulfurtransferase
MAARAGHIPGARSVPFASMLDEQGRFLPKDALRGKLPASGTLVPYCHIGQQATVIYFTARMLGREVRLYDGSFRDWAGREGYPVVKD